MSDVNAIEGKCQKCGGTVFSAPDNPADSDWITCDGCGERFMSWQQFKAATLSLAAKAIQKEFGKVKGFKPF